MLMKTGFSLIWGWAKKQRGQYPKEDPVHLMSVKKEELARLPETLLDLK